METNTIPTHYIPIGTILKDRYRIDDYLGEGGFGITYKGTNIVLNLTVAIKEYFPMGYANRFAASGLNVTLTDQRKSDSYTQWKEKFLSEARTLAKFSNIPGIVSVYDFFEDNDTAYIVMEYLEGITLKEYVSTKGIFTLEKLASKMLPLLCSLQEIHKTGLIHRDISPDNIMVMNDGSFKLFDFGAAREFENSGERSMSIILRHGYAPFEQYSSHAKQGPFTDVYAISGVMYYCLTGITPIESIERSYDDDLKPLTDFGIPEHINAVIMKGLALRSQDRFQSVSELIIALGGKPSDTETDTYKAKDSSVNGLNNRDRYHDGTVTLDPSASKTDRTEYIFENNKNSNTDTINHSETRADRTEYIFEDTDNLDDVTSSNNSVNANNKEPEPKTQPQPVPKRKNKAVPIIVAAAAVVVVAGGIVAAVFLNSGNQIEVSDTAETTTVATTSPIITTEVDTAADTTRAPETTTTKKTTAKTTTTKRTEAVTTVPATTVQTETTTVPPQTKATTTAKTTAKTKAETTTTAAVTTSSSQNNTEYKVAGKKYKTSTTKIDLSGKKLNNSDIKNLKYFKKLKELNLSNTGISDISPLSDCTSLEILDLSYNPINDFSPLFGLKKICCITLRGYVDLSIAGLNLNGSKDNGTMPGIKWEDAFSDWCFCRVISDSYPLFSGKWVSFTMIPNTDWVQKVVFYSTEDGEMVCKELDMEYYTYANDGLIVSNYPTMSETMDILKKNGYM